MATEKYRRKDSQPVSPDFEIIGTGNIGEKARQLMDKTPTLKKIGFQVPRRTVFAEGFFDEFFQRSGLGRSMSEVGLVDNAEARVLNGTLSAAEFTTLQGVAASYGNNPLVIRSSAEGDARGTGTYSSEFTENKIGSIGKSLIRVLASYFSEDATDFRRDAAVKPGMGIIVEPLIGQRIGGDFAPVISGAGYTSTSSGQGYMKIVPGLGGGVDSKKAFKVYPRDLVAAGSTLEDVMFYYENRIEDSTTVLPALMNRKTYSKGYSLEGNAYMEFPEDSIEPSGMYPALIAFDYSLQRKLYDINLRDFFTRIAKIEQAQGRAQYVEWAMTFKGRKPVFWLLQIADVNKNLDTFEFGEHGLPLFEGHTVVGSKQTDCSALVVCQSSDNLDELREFNKTNAGHVVIYSSDVISGRSQYISGRENNIRKITYSDISNASALIEIDDTPGHEDPIEHWKGQLNETKKLFGVVSGTTRELPGWEELMRNGENRNGLVIVDKDFKVVASERQNRIALYAKE